MVSSTQLFFYLTTYRGVQMYDILTDLERWFDQNQPVGLASVISTWGSAPRRVGAMMAFTTQAEISGSVSGGCVEGAVVEAGIRAIQTGRPELLQFGVADETAYSVGLACGGNIEVFVRRLEPGLFQAVRKELQLRKPVAIVSVISGPESLIGCEILVTSAGKSYGSLGEGMDETAIQIARQSIENEQSQSISPDWQGHETIRLFVNVIAPLPELIIVGGVHIAITLSTLAKSLGYRTVVIDPRRVFSSPDRFPHVDQLIQAWPDEAFQQVTLTRNSCVAVLTHDPKIDDPALKVVLNSPAFYVGVLGSRKTHAKRRQRLLAEGFSEDQLNRLHAPIGLDLGGESPEETALSILAEIVAVRRG